MSSPEEDHHHSKSGDDVVDAIRINSMQDILNNNSNNPTSGLSNNNSTNNNTLENNSSNNNNSGSKVTSSTTTPDPNKGGAVANLDNIASAKQLQKIDSFTEKELKALLDEAINYKNPRDREKSSDTFKELLKRAENEEKSLESNLACIPFKASGGGSLQNICESVNSETWKKGSRHNRTHGQHYSNHTHIINNNQILHSHCPGVGGVGGIGGVVGSGGGTGGGTAAVLVGSAVGGGHGVHYHSVHHHGKSGSVSSRQREGGSLPSNVNFYPGEQPFLSEVKQHKRRNNSGNYNNNSSNTNNNTIINTSNLSSLETSGQNISSNSSAGGGGDEMTIKSSETVVSNTVAGSAAAQMASSLGASVAVACLVRNSSSSVNSKDAKDGPASLSTDSTGIGTGSSVGASGASLSDKNQSIIINIGDYPECQGDCAPKKLINNHDVISEYGRQQNRLIPRPSLQNHQYRTNVKINIDDSESGLGGTTSLMSSTATSVSAAGNRELGAAGKQQQQQQTENVDKGIKLGLENKMALSDQKGGTMQLDSKYESVKSLGLDGGGGSELKELQPQVKVYMPAQLQGNLEETYRVINPMPVAQMAQMTLPATKQKKKLSKHDRNTTTMESDNIVGFRGYEQDVDRLVQFIESKENTEGGKESMKKGKNKNSTKKDNHQNSGGKLKKSNSMNELRSCSKLDEIVDSGSSGNGAVALRAKNKNKNQNSHTNNNGASVVIDQKNGNGTGQSSSSNTKRGDRRSWGTEELSYLGDNDHSVDNNNNSNNNSNKKKENKDKDLVLTEGNNTGSKKEKNERNSSDQKVATTDDVVVVKPAKTLTEMAINSISMDSVLSSSWTNELAEFHVVTKKRKSKKKQNIVVQPFDVNRNFQSNASSASQSNNSNSNSSNNKKSIGQATAHETHQRLRGGSSTSMNHNSNRPNTSSSSVSNSRHIQQSSGNSNHSHSQSNSHSSSGGSSNQHNQKVQKSRRKSTSSMPPSDKSDCSDLDSVHSLPIESPSLADKSKRQQNSAATKDKKSPTVQQSTNSQISYADIAKIANKAEGSTNGNSKNHNNSPNSSENNKWPTIGKDSSSQNADPVPEHNNDNNNPKNMSPNEEKQKMSDVIKSSHTEVVVAPTGVMTITSNSVNSLEYPISKSVLQKSKSMDNESSLATTPTTTSASVFNMNIDQYPSLEKSVKGHQKASSNSASKIDTTSNPTLSSNSSAVPNNAVVVKKAKLLSSIVGAGVAGVGVTLGINANNLNPTVNHLPMNNINFITNNVENMAVKTASAINKTVTVDSATTTTIVNHNGGINNSSSSSSGSSNLNTSIGLSQQSRLFEKLKTTKNRTNPVCPQQNQQHQQQESNANRPAVIILNDERYNRLNEGEITFGFDIDSDLLFGDFEEEELQFLDTTAMSNDDNAVITTSKLMPSSSSSSNQMDQINTSDYNSYNSSMASSKGKSSSSNQELDSNNNTSTDTVMHMNEVEDLIVAKRQSTPKGQTVLNCSNCRKADDGQIIIAPGGSLMKNSCVQTSLDNLILVNDISFQDTKSDSKGLLTNGLSNSTEVQIIAFDNQLEPPPDSAIIRIKKQINIRYVDPSEEVFSAIWHNHEKIVDFVGLAWDDLTHNQSENVKYYNGK